MIKPDGYLNIGKVLSLVESSGFTLGNLKTFRITQQDAEEFYAAHKGKNYFQALTQFMCSDLIVGLELINDDCITRWAKLMGPENPKSAKKDSPNSLRALFGEDGMKNAVHGSESQAVAQKELDFVFSNKSKLKVSIKVTVEPCILQQLHLLHHQTTYSCRGPCRSHHRLHPCLGILNQCNANVLA